MQAHIVAELYVPSKGRSETCDPQGEHMCAFPVTQDFVLTCWHGLNNEERDDKKPVEIRWRDSSGRVILNTDDQCDEGWREVGATVWKNEELDIAVLACDSIPKGLAGKVCFADARPLGNSTWNSWSYPKGVGRDPDGTTRCEPMSGKTEDWFPDTTELPLDCPVGLSNALAWRGASGAPVFVDNKLVGVVRTASTAHEGRRLWATAAWHLFYAMDTDTKEKFCDFLGISSSVLIRQYCDWAHRQPEVEVDLQRSDEYSIEPSDLLEIFFARENQPTISLEELLGRIKGEALSEVTIILGEAGVGKTTSLKHIRKRLTKEDYDGPIVPIYIPLGGWTSDIPPDISFQKEFNGQFEQVSISLEELLMACAKEKHQVLLLLDGLNEVTPDQFSNVENTIWRFIRNERKIYPNIYILSTSRPMMRKKFIFEPQEGFLEIIRWTEAQLEKFLRKNNRGIFIEEIKQLSSEKIRDCFRLPLFASLLANLTKDGKDFREFEGTGMAGVMEYFLSRFLEITPKKTRNIPDLPGITVEIQKHILRKLAYEMNARGTVQITGDRFEKVVWAVIGENYGYHFNGLFASFVSYGVLRCLANFINRGILRCADRAVPDLENLSRDEYQELKINFFHQAFQEYLTARYFITLPGFGIETPPAKLPQDISWQDLIPLPEFGLEVLPTDISHDMFWREIPLYMIQSLPNASKQRDFGTRFLEIKDYLTCARIANEIPGSKVADEMRGKISDALAANIKEQNYYHYAIETVEVLGEEGKMALGQCLEDDSALANTFAKAENHILKESLGEGGKKSLLGNSDDSTWRSLGRSVYILGEVKDQRLTEYLLIKEIPRILSIHLLYHVAEALLSLARDPGLTDSQRRNIENATRRLMKHPRCDPVVVAYSCAILKELKQPSPNVEENVFSLTKFLEESADQKRKFFQVEFWRRAHGVEALSEIVTEPKDCSEILNKMWVQEDLASYEGYEEKGYRLVQSSIVKAMRRSCRLSPNSRTTYKELLEKIFCSGRASENEWACRILELFLNEWFSTTETNLIWVTGSVCGDLGWIKNWQDSRDLGGRLMRETLSNVWQQGVVLHSDCNKSEGQNIVIDSRQ
uniref:NACHT domain-containing protein n=1 Tax=Candidatus Kentrum sp. MB TaxID=2138164 RepID=A0A450XLN7_9GAMM|nr:MAG: NACHT domain-containing protein [Candidatus Kentron sp. MB]VFK75125.1 MAG: NACHT domain-containing protein [Candidatus Kentron sp. MB]